MLLILLDNAIKHTPAGGKVTVEARRQGSRCPARGCRQRAGHRARASAARSSTASTAPTRPARATSGGTGLGLAIAKMLVEAHGAELTVSSTAGLGTQATLRLRLITAPARGGRFTELAARLTRGAARPADPAELSSVESEAVRRD